MNGASEPLNDPALPTAVGNPHEVVPTLCVEQLAPKIIRSCMNTIAPIAMLALFLSSGIVAAQGLRPVAINTASLAESA